MGLLQELYGDDAVAIPQTGLTFVRSPRGNIKVGDIVDLDVALTGDGLSGEHCEVLAIRPRQLQVTLSLWDSVMARRYDKTLWVNTSWVFTLYRRI